MPEGPTLIILKEALKSFSGRRVTAASGYAKNVDPLTIVGNTLTNIKSWGKHLLINFKGFTIRIHMGLFGSYRINSRGKKKASLHLQFENDEVNFYISKVEIIKKPLNTVYDWSADIMSKKWDADKAMEKLKSKPAIMICDALLDQHIFAGSGNIIKNEALFRARIHPESKCAKIPDEQLRNLIDETVKFSQDFLEWKKVNMLMKHLQAYKKEICPRNHVRFHKADTGKGKRKSYFCIVCQMLYS